MDATGHQLPPPADWPAFERQMRRLFVEVLGDPNTYLTGRSGQAQGGVDIIGRRLGGHRGYVGIQCKLKDELAASTRLGRRALLAELEKAAALDPPPLTEFILVTTASDDADLQAYARELTERNEAAGGPSVHVFGWHQLRAMIGEHPALLAEYLPRAVDDGIARTVNATYAEVGRLADLLRDAISTRDPDQAGRGGADAVVGRAIDRANAKVGGPRTRDALDELLDLQRCEWEGAGEHVRFRLLTAVAVARWELGDLPEAARLVVAAAEIEPRSERALANLVAGHLAAGRPDLAVEAGCRLRDLHPGSEQGIIALLQAREELFPSADPLAFLPIGLRDTREAIIGAAQVLRRRGDAAWHALARRAAAEDPETPLLARMLAESVLERLAATDGAHVGARGEGVPARSEVEHAAGVLVTQWREHAAMTPYEIDFALAANASQLLRMLGRGDEAIEILRQARTLGEAPPEHALLLAVLLATRGDRQEAVDVLTPLPRTVDVAITLAQMSEGEPEIVRSVLAEAEWSEASPRERAWRDTLDWEAARELGDPSATIGALAAVVARWPRSLPPRIAMVRAAPAEDRETLMAEAVAAVDEATPFGEIMQLALLLRVERRWGPLLELLRDRITLERDSEGLRWMIEALSETGDREGLVAVFDVIPPTVADLDHYLRNKVSVLLDVGSLSVARAAAERFAARRPHDLERRLDWVRIVMRQNDRDALLEWLSGPVEQLEAEPSAQADLALLLANNGFGGRSRNLAYRLARLHPGVQHVQERFLGVMIASSRDGDPLLSFDRVSPDLVFMAADVDGRLRTFRIETERDLPPESIDIPPESPVATAASGLAAGGVYQLPPSLPGADPTRFEILEVKHKHLHLMHETMKTLKERFPKSEMFHAVRTGEDGEGQNVLLAQVVRRERAVERAFARYHASGTPLRMLPIALGGDVIDAYDGLAECDARFLAVDANPTIRVVEAEVIRRRRPDGVLVDALTLELLRRFEMTDVVEALLGGIHATQSALDVFSGRVATMEAMPGRTLGTLVQKDGRLARVDVAPATVEAILDARRRARGWAAAIATVVPAAGPKGLAAGIAAAVGDTATGDLLDDVLAAAQADIPLLTADRGYRQVARSIGIPAVSLHAIVECAAEAGLVTRSRRIRLIAKMARAGHHFLPLSSGDLRDALSADGDTPGEILDSVLLALGGADADPATHSAVAIGFVEAVWRIGKVVPHRLRVGRLVAHRLFDGGARREALVAALFADPDAWPDALRRAGAAIREETPETEARPPSDL